MQIGSTFFAKLIAISICLRQNNHIRPNYSQYMRWPVPKTLKEKPKYSYRELQLYSA